MKKIELKTNEWNPYEKPDTEVKKQVQPRNSNWGELSGIQDPKIIRFFEGLNTMTPFAIKESHGAKVKNTTSREFPTLSIRPGISVIGADIGAGKVLGIGGHKGQVLNAVVNGAWYTYDAANGWVQKKTGLSTTELWSFTNFRGNFDDINLIGTNGVDEALKFDGANVTPLANAPVNAKFMVSHSNRLYCVVANTLRFSALRKGEDWSTVDDAGEIVIETSDGRHISGLVSGPDKLVLFKKNSMHELYGTNPSNYQLKEVSNKIGSPAGYSAQLVNGLLYFLGNDAIYRYTGGGLPDSKFSIRVQKYIDGVNKDWVHRSVSGTDGKRYFLSIPYGAATEPNVTIEYDPDVDTWNVWEFADGITAGFTGVDNRIYAGNVLGEVVELTGETDKGQPITWEWESKPLSFDSLAAKSRWYRLWIVADVPVNSTLDIYLSDKAEGENWTSVKTISENADIQDQQILIPVDYVFLSNYMRIKLVGSGRAKVYEITRQERVFPMGQ